MDLSRATSTPVSDVSLAVNRYICSRADGARPGERVTAIAVVYWATFTGRVVNSRKRTDLSLGGAFAKCRTLLNK